MSMVCWVVGTPIGKENTLTIRLQRSAKGGGENGLLNFELELPPGEAGR